MYNRYLYKKKYYLRLTLKYQGNTVYLLSIFIIVYIVKYHGHNTTLFSVRLTSKGYRKNKLQGEKYYKFLVNDTYAVLICFRWLFRWTRLYILSTYTEPGFLILDHRCYQVRVVSGRMIGSGCCVLVLVGDAVDLFLVRATQQLLRVDASVFPWAAAHLIVTVHLL